ncbi:hypothetical protein QEH42_gp130 [Microbacterium phage Pumpernickel]|uniref:Uncharacterized protein n=1 Tax=Microbacterium phage Pumpernickel TaxID=2885983 RepID=A0AAE9C2E0_9CAUD|nr:hypothetical protein QEH42_gp037 [Microbacterium phage Pumpernickel]YP_010755328.1 hypothetical protein QEH42_gp130 [Microbacterium phage Pumpernickel]UDL15828.1 hypothetical protein SEA_PUMPERNICKEL_37 [Microbacterium phage Pumpernickel]UDL16088.1 hypothetical protein SEA_PUMPERNICKEL_338 [Microbacterium phage Pumpernickel]
MEGYNEVKRPNELAAGDRIILNDGFADVLEIVSVSDVLTTFRANEDGHGEVEIAIENTLLLEVERRDS